MAGAIDLFIKSDSGYVLCLALILLGASDLACGWYIFRHRPELLPIPEAMRPRMVALLFFAASFMLLTGLYMLTFHL